MTMYVFVIVILGIIGVTMAVPTLLPAPAENEVLTYDFPFVTRYQWGARSAKEKTALQTPVPYVVIHHSYRPAACYDAGQCKKAMQSMQNFHMDDRGWWDIGYNFAVGSDGAVYEGRGWDVMGAHALHFNSVSLGICLIGDWTNSLPPTQQIKTAKALIAAGVELGYIKANYKLLGHRQVRDTECPGEVLYQNVKSWQHYAAFPANYRDLVYVKELKKEIREKLRIGNVGVCTTYDRVRGTCTLLNMSTRVLPLRRITSDNVLLYSLSTCKKVDINGIINHQYLIMNG